MTEIGFQARDGLIRTEAAELIAEVAGRHVRHITEGGLTPENADKIGALALTRQAIASATFPAKREDLLLAISLLMGAIGVIDRDAARQPSNTNR